MTELTTTQRIDRALLEHLHRQMMAAKVEVGRRRAELEDAEFCYNEAAYQCMHLDRLLVRERAKAPPAVQQSLASRWGATLKKAWRRK